MASTPEAAVKKAVKRLLDKHAIWHFSPSMNGYGRAGIPDIIACCKGLFLGIECKAGKGQTTVLQQRELDAIENHGGYTFVAREDNLDRLEKHLCLLTGKSTKA